MFENMDWPGVVLICALLVTFSLQVWLTVKVRRKVWHFIPLCICVSAVIGFYIAAICTEGWDAIGYLLLMIYSGFFAAADVAGLGIGYILRFFLRKKRRDNPQEPEV